MELLERVQLLSDRVDALEDPAAREAAQDLVGAVLELHGAGLARIGEVLDEAGPAGGEAKRKLLDDGIVASLLLIHDLYPVPLEERVREALAEVEPYLDSHGGGVELLGVEDGVVRLALQGSCEGCPASAATLELAIKEALEKAAPDIVGLEVEGVVEEEAAPEPLGIWMDLGAPSPRPGTVAAVRVGGTAIAVANVDGSLLAFRDTCAGCGEPIAAGALEEGVLACPSCAQRFFLPRAGRSLDAEGVLLAPVPLLEAGGAVTVAVA